MTRDEINALSQRGVNDCKMFEENDNFIRPNTTSEDLIS